MTQFTVAIQEGEAGPTAQTTRDIDEALDWFTNACTEVMDDKADVTFASLAVDGVVCGMIREGGLSPEGGEVVVPLRKAG